METTRRIRPALERYYRKSLHSPDRIVVGQIGCTHSAAEELCSLGLWERSGVEHSRYGDNQRYRVVGMAYSTPLDREPKSG